MRLVIVESRHAGRTPEQIEQFAEYRRRAMLFCLSRGWAPMASHRLYTDVLDDARPEERAHGIRAGLAWAAAAEASAVFVDHGISPGMELGITDAIAKGRLVEYYSLTSKCCIRCGAPTTAYMSEALHELSCCLPLICNVDHTHETRPAVSGGECALCFHRAPLHEPTCSKARCRHDAALKSRLGAADVR